MKNKGQREKNKIKRSDVFASKNKKKFFNAGIKCILFTGEEIEEEEEEEEEDDDDDGEQRAYRPYTCDNSVCFHCLKLRCNGHRDSW